jgi:hypothetical protein
VTGGKPIAILLQSISGVSAINHLVAFYDIHGGKREALFFYFVPDTTRDLFVCLLLLSDLLFWCCYMFNNNLRKKERKTFIGHYPMAQTIQTI